MSPERCIEESVDKSSRADAITSALMEAVSSGKFSARDNWESCGNEEEAVHQGKGLFSVSHNWARYPFHHHLIIFSGI
jgi:hypothetical protein